MISHLLLVIYVFPRATFISLARFFSEQTCNIWFSALHFLCVLFQFWLFYHDHIIYSVDLSEILILFKFLFEILLFTVLFRFYFSLFFLYSNCSSRYLYVPLAEIEFLLYFCHILLIFKTKKFFSFLLATESLYSFFLDNIYDFHSNFFLVHNLVMQTYSLDGFQILNEFYLHYILTLYFSGLLQLYSIKRFLAWPAVCFRSI